MTDEEKRLDKEDMDILDDLYKAYDDGYAQGRADAIEKCIRFVDEWDSVIADALSKNMKEHASPYDMEIKQALEKQMPKELTSVRKVKQYDGYDMGNCPVCGEPLDNSFYENLKYCFVCGQAIKWE